MTSKELNKKLLQAVPELKKTFDEFTSWQEGIETGSHTVFENLVVPFAIDIIENEKDEVIKRLFNLIEGIITSKDEYAEEVVQLSFLEPLKAEHGDEYDFSKIMSKETYSLFNSLEY